MLLIIDRTIRPKSAVAFGPDKFPPLSTAKVPIDAVGYAWNTDSHYNADNHVISAVDDFL